MTGPWVTELSNETRQTLASLDPGRIPSVAANWIQAEEFRGQMDVATAEQIVGEMRTLALRAEQAGEPLYCWTSL